MIIAGFSPLSIVASIPVGLLLEEWGKNNDEKYDLIFPNGTFQNVSGEHG